MGDEKFYVGSLAGNSVISISAKTTEPELAMKLLEKIHTDIRYYSLVACGVEGNNYKLVDGKISFDGINPRDHFAWTAVSDEVLNYEAEPINEQWYRDAYHVFTEWNQEMGMQAEENPLDGFNFEIPAAEQAAADRIWLQYFQPLVCGYGEDYLQELEEANGRLYEAGFDRYMELVQEQLSECRAVNRDGGGVPSVALTE